MGPCAPCGEKRGSQKEPGRGSCQEVPAPRNTHSLGAGIRGVWGASEPAPGTTLLFPALLASVTVKKKVLMGLNDSFKYAQPEHGSTEGALQMPRQILPAYSSPGLL